MLEVAVAGEGVELRVGVVGEKYGGEEEDDGVGDKFDWDRRGEEIVGKR